VFSFRYRLVTQQNVAVMFGYDRYLNGWSVTFNVAEVKRRGKTVFVSPASPSSTSLDVLRMMVNDVG